MSFDRAVARTAVSRVSGIGCTLARSYDVTHAASNKTFPIHTTRASLVIYTCLFTDERSLAFYARPICTINTGCRFAPIDDASTPDFPYLFES